MWTINSVSKKFQFTHILVRHTRRAATTTTDYQAADALARTVGKSATLVNTGMSLDDRPQRLYIISNGSVTNPDYM